jgi:hypothetical protein
MHTSCVYLEDDGTQESGTGGATETVASQIVLIPNPFSRPRSKPVAKAIKKLEIFEKPISYLHIIRLYSFVSSLTQNGLIGSGWFLR